MFIFATICLSATLFLLGVLYGAGYHETELEPKKFEAVKAIRHFSSRITRLEGGKKKISVAQVSEVLKLVNQETNGEFYKFLKGVK